MMFGLSSGHHQAEFSCDEASSLADENEDQALHETKELLPKSTHDGHNRSISHLESQNFSIIQAIDESDGFNGKLASSSYSSLSSSNESSRLASTTITTHSPPSSCDIRIIRRRSDLPHPTCGKDFSLFSILRKNVGKDLSQVSLPISLNEPISATQKICEELEYADELLLKAVKSNSNPLERLMFIAAFVVSGFCHTKTRAIRKPFNPMLGETFECVRPDKGFKFLSEKVSHHPPILSAYAEGENWKLEMNSSGRQKFWGQSLEITPEGFNRLTIFNDFNDHIDDSSSSSHYQNSEVYEWDKPSSFVRNLVSGTKYLEHIGKVGITKRGSNEKATIEFKPGSTFGGEGSRNKVEVKVYDGSGNLGICLNGKWDSYLIRSDTNQKVFEAHPLPPRCTEFYGFTQFTIELNELTADLMSGTGEDEPEDPNDGPKHGYLLAPSDSRLRPDLRLYEKGKIEEAETVKKELEEKQRNRRKFDDLDRLLPIWFEAKDGKNWTYKGGYFENRCKNKPEWHDQDIFHQQATFPGRA